MAGSLDTKWRHGEHMEAVLRYSNLSESGTEITEEHNKLSLKDSK